MTQRERQASGTLSEPAPRPAGGQTVPARSHVAPEPAIQPAPTWEECYRNASPAQQREFLALAERQGILYAHQLPAPVNGTPTDRPRRLVTQLLAGRTDDLEPVQSVPVNWIDTELDAVQREAVVRSLSTPDLCLIQGMPGTGKSRVIAELVTQAAALGQRVLMLGSSPAAIDRVLEQVGSRPVLYPIRCLGRDERLEDLAPAVRAVTFPERLRQLTESTLHGARRLAQETEERCRQYRQAETVLKQMQELTGQLEELAERQVKLQHEKAAEPGAVEREMAALEAGENPVADQPLHTAVTACLAARQQTLQRIDASQAELAQGTAKAQQELDALVMEIAGLNAFVEAKQLGRWWTWTWWQASQKGDVVGIQAEMASRQQALEKTIADGAEEQRRLEQAKVEAQQNFAVERTRLYERELARRQEQIQERAGQLAQQRNILEEQWHKREQELGPATPRPAARTVVAVQAAEDGRRVQLEKEEHQAGFARAWAGAVEQNVARFPVRLAAQANLVVGTPASLAADEHFGDRAGARPCFDLLIMEEADRLAESDLLQVANRARRWVLVGEPGGEPDSPAPAERDRPPAGRRDNNRSGRPGGLGRTGPLSGARLTARLWQQLHCDPRRLPYAWVQEAGHWCCRLRDLTDGQRRQMECERVDDCPEIELRILTQPRLPPMLAEVVFPAAMTLERAKEFIFRELQELPIQAQGHSFFWLEETERLVLRLSDGPAAGTIPVTLETGVREIVSVPPAQANGDRPHVPVSYTCRLEFERSAGWDRRRAEEWVHDHLPIRDLGRTVRLDVPHRMHPDLALFLADLLGPGDYSLVSRQPQPEHLVRDGWGPCPVEFMPVPSVSDSNAGRQPPTAGKPENGRRPGGPQRPHSGSRGGAGLEVDLADPRQRERLPAEVRNQLPPQGLVNFPEAQAVVGYLENLAQRDEATDRPTVGVAALYPAQVQLIRCLIRQSPVLSRAGLPLLVGDPSAFRERECRIMILSLTRSHSHRAVAYGENPQHLVLALTRARARLILFGDAGTLVRRCQWEGPVDHLDETAAGRERQLFGELASYLQGQGAHPRVFHLREGKCT